MQAKAIFKSPSVKPSYSKDCQCNSLIFPRSQNQLMVHLGQDTTVFFISSPVVFLYHVVGLNDIIIVFLVSRLKER